MTNPYMVKIGLSGNGSTGPFAGSYPSQQITDLLTLGVGTVFFQVRWSTIDANATGNPNNYVWGAWDQCVSQCNQAGIDVVLTLFQPPQAFLVTGESTAAIPSKMAQYAANVAHAYTNGDPLQRGTRHIRGLYIGNEDYDAGKWPTQPDLLVPVLKATYPAVKSINSNMLVIAAAKIQRSKNNYTAWFDTILNTSTGAYIGGVFQADALTFHYHASIPAAADGTPTSPDPSKDFPTSGGDSIPSWETCWKVIQSKMQQYGQNLPIYADENGEPVNTNPNRSPNAVLSESTRSGYINYELNQAMNSGVVTHYGIYTVGENTYGAGTSDPGQRDGDSLIQNDNNGNPIYGATWSMMKNFISNNPTWTPGSSLMALIGLAHDKFVTKNTKSSTRARSKFSTKYSALKTTTQSTFKIQQVIRNLVALSRSTFKIQSISSVKNLLGQVFSKFLIYVPPHHVDLDYAHDTFSGSDGIDTFVGVDGSDSLNGIG